LGKNGLLSAATAEIDSHKQASRGKAKRFMRRLGKR
jgi:hypothetical protein